MVRAHSKEREHLLRPNRWIRCHRALRLIWMSRVDWTVTLRLVMKNPKVIRAEKDHTVQEKSSSFYSQQRT